MSNQETSVPGGWGAVANAPSTTSSAPSSTAGGSGTSVVVPGDTRTDLQKKMGVVLVGRSQQSNMPSTSSGQWSVGDKLFNTEQEANAYAKQENETRQKQIDSYYNLLDTFRGGIVTSPQRIQPPLNPNYVYVPESKKYPIGGTTDRPTPSSRPSPGNSIADAIKPGEMLAGIRESTAKNIEESNKLVSAWIPSGIKSNIQKGHDQFKEVMRQVEVIQRVAGGAASQTPAQTRMDALKRDITMKIGDTAFYAAQDITDRPVTFASNAATAAAITKIVGFGGARLPWLTEGIPLGKTAFVGGAKSASSIISPLNVAGAAMGGLYVAGTVKNYQEAYKEAATQKGFDPNEFAGKYRGQVAAELIGMGVGSHIANTVTVASVTNNMKTANRILSQYKASAIESAKGTLKMADVATEGKLAAIYRVARTGKVPYDPVKIADSVFEVATHSNNMKQILITDAMKKKAVEMGYDVSKLEAELSKEIDIGYKKPVSGNLADYYREKGFNSVELPIGFEKDPSFKMMDRSNKNKLVDKYENNKIRERISKEPMRDISPEDDFLAIANKAHAESMRKAEGLIKTGQVFVQDIKEAYITRQKPSITIESGRIKTVQVMERQKVDLILKEEIMKTHLNSLKVVDEMVTPFQTTRGKSISEAVKSIEKQVASSRFKRENLKAIQEQKAIETKKASELMQKAKSEYYDKQTEKSIEIAKARSESKAIAETRARSKAILDAKARSKLISDTNQKIKTIYGFKSSELSKIKEAVKLVPLYGLENITESKQKEKAQTSPAIADAVKIFQNIAPIATPTDTVKDVLVVPQGFKRVNPLGSGVIPRITTTPPKTTTARPPNRPSEEKPPKTPIAGRRKLCIPGIDKKCTPILLSAKDLDDYGDKYKKHKKHIHVWDVKNPVPNLFAYLRG